MVIPGGIPMKKILKEFREETVELSLEESPGIPGGNPKESLEEYWKETLNPRDLEYLGWNPGETRGILRENPEKP